MYVNSEVVFSGDSGRPCGISGPLPQNDKVAVCYCSSLLCLIVSLSCSSSTSLINSILGFFFFPSCYSNMSILLEKSSFNTVFINQQRGKQKGGQYFQLSPTVSSRSHLCWCWKVTIGMVTMDLCIPAPLCTCFYDRSSNPKDFQQLVFFAAEAIP